MNHFQRTTRPRPAVRVDLTGTALEQVHFVPCWERRSLQLDIGLSDSPRTYAND
jgi:hypothetical protein